MMKRGTSDSVNPTEDIATPIEPKLIVPFPFKEMKGVLNFNSFFFT